MVANANMASQAGKYARYELERKFLLDHAPEGLEPETTIYDRYITGTRLRLRRVEHPDGRLEYKLNQKESPSPPNYGVMTITSIYLTAEEYEVLCVLPAAELRKRRHHLGRYSIDVFEGGLAGLILAETEFASEEEMHAHVPPDFVGREVSDDVRYTGGELAYGGQPS
jgi:CYTH domain-containing protein